MVMRIKDIITIRKTIAAIAVLVLMLSMSVAVYAREIEGEGLGYQTITVNFEAPEWVMIIPADVIITPYTSDVDIGKVEIRLNDSSTLKSSDVIKAWITIPPDTCLEKENERGETISFSLEGCPYDGKNLLSRRGIPVGDEDNVCIAVHTGSDMLSENIHMMISDEAWQNAAYGTYKRTLNYWSNLSSLN